MGSLLASLRRWIRERWRMWFKGDAIRSSPTERHWLTLQPPCVTLWQGERIEVLSREEETSSDGPVIRLECRTPRGRETLLIHPGDLHQPPRLAWREPRNTRKG